MKRSAAEKYGVMGVMFSAFFAGIFAEGRSQEAATVFFAVALISLGVLLTMVVVDWWIDRHGGDRGGDPRL